MESLREQLERSQGEVMELQQTTSDLKAQLRATRREHHDSMNDMEGDQSRFMGQVGTSKMIIHFLNDNIETMMMKMYGLQHILL